MGAASVGMIMAALDRWRMPADLPFWEVHPSILLAWAILVETEIGVVDIGPCLVCGGDGAVETGVEHCGMHERLACRECDGSGREVINAGRLLLSLSVGFPRGRETLLVGADELQAEGDPRGELIALALGPWMGPPTEPVVLTFSGATRREAWEAAIRYLREHGHHATIEVRSPSGQGAWTPEPEEHVAVVTLAELGYPRAGEFIRWLDQLTETRNGSAHV